MPTDPDQSALGEVVEFLAQILGSDAMASLAAVTAANGCLARSGQARVRPQVT